MYSGRITDRFEPVLRQKLGNIHAQDPDVALCDDDIGMIRETASRQLAAGADFLILTGGMSVDPDDLTRRPLPTWVRGSVAAFLRSREYDAGGLFKRHSDFGNSGGSHSHAHYSIRCPPARCFCRGSDLPARFDTTWRRRALPTLPPMPFSQLYLWKVLRCLTPIQETLLICGCP